MLETIKNRLGIYYSDTNKDNEVLSIVDAALTYFNGAGWEVSHSDPSPLAIEALVLYAKMVQSTDVKDLYNHPVLTSMIAQGRAEK